MLHSLSLGEAPIASHLLWTQPGLLDDAEPEQRTAGMNAGWAWIAVADAMVVYAHRGISPGMEATIRLANELGLDIDFRLPPDSTIPEGKYSVPRTA